jgi:hypothetical protein
MEQPEPIEDRRSPLFSATLAFLSSIGLVVLLFFVVGQYGWLGAGDAPVFIPGDYLARHPKTVAGTPATSEAAGVDGRFTFSPDGSVAVLLHGGRTSGFYHVEKGRVTVEVPDSRGIVLRWDFSLDGERLVGNGVILERQPD